MRPKYMSSLPSELMGMFGAGPSPVHRVLSEQTWKMCLADAGTCCGSCVIASFWGEGVNNPSMYTVCLVAFSVNQVGSFASFL